jgi:signal transduction histidine kinase/CHASE2 domain-containing sensor protein/CheY-like chemotaxis protein
MPTSGHPSAPALGSPLLDPAHRRPRPSPGITLVLATLLILVSLVLLLPSSVPGSYLARASYDLSFRLLNPPDFSQPGSSPLQLIYLDRRTFTDLNQDPGQPLDRTLHARLIRRLTDAGASLILFDILFDQPGPNPAADAALADAIRNHGQVVLGAEWHRSDRVQPRATSINIRSITLPASNLLAAAAGHGFVFSRVDPDFVVRRHFPGFLDRDLPSLTWEAARQLNLPITRDPMLSATPRWLHYYGPPLTLPHLSFADALDPAATPDDLFRNKVILIGTRPTIGHFDERRDEWRHPIARWGQGPPFMPAAEVHATEWLNLLRGDWLRRPNPTVETMAFCLSALLLTLVLVRLRPISAAGAALAAEILVLLAVAGLLAWNHTWFPWLILCVIQIPAALTGSFLLHSLTWYRQRRRFLARIREQAALLDKAQDAILVLDLNPNPNPDHGLHLGLPTQPRHPEVALPRLHLSYANPRAMALYGWNVLTLGNPDALTQLDDPTQRLAVAIRETLITGDWTGELHQRNALDQPIVVESRATLIRDPQGHPRQILFIHTDITERKRLQEQFLQAQRREGIGALAGGMAHDLNNALSPILMGIQLLRSRTTDPATLRMLEIMESNTQRGAGMVRQVLLFARGHDTLSGPIHLPPLLRELDGVLRQCLPAEINVSVLAPDDLWLVQANPTQLHQILLNLCLNARDAMPSGGQLTLAADNAHLSPEELTDLPGLETGRHVMLLVSDTGTGIPPEIQARLFEPFFTTKPPGRGTGLGLATVASLVKTHHGALRLHSQPGEGTSIEIYLPALAPASVPDSNLHTLTPHPNPESPTGHNERILVANDELSLRDLLREGLAAHGYRPLTASSGVEAVSLARLHAAELRLAIVDASLSVLPGQNLAETLRTEHPSLPLLLLTEDLPHVHPNPVASDPHSTFLTKPFPLDSFLKTVRNQIR